MSVSIRDHAITLLGDLIAFDTTSRNSNLPLIDYVASYLKKLGVSSTVIYNEDRTKANLLTLIGPQISGGVVLSGHTDVVPVDGQDWDMPPFTLFRQNDLFYGRGTADMKSFLAIMLAMVPTFLKSPLTKPIHLAFSYDEEVGCLGVHSLIEQIIAQGLAPSLAIIGEPTSMEVINAHKGIHSFETVVTGLEAHSSAVDKGVNAVMYAAELIHYLNELQEEYRQKPTSILAGRFDPPYTTIHVGVVSGGIARNIIPKHCVFNWEIRLLPDDDAEHIIRRIEEKSEHMQQKMQKTCAQATIITRKTSYAPDLNPESDAEAEELLLSLSHHTCCKAVSFITEAGIFQKNHIPALICGPGNIMQAHKPNEYITIGQIDECIAFMERLNERLCT